MKNKIKNITKTILAVAVVATLTLALIPLVKPEKTYAGDIYVTTGYLDLWVGDGTTFYIVGNNVAGTYSAWSDNGGVASAGGGGWVENGSAPISVYACGAGYATVYVSYSVSDFDDDTQLYSGTFAIGVNVDEWTDDDGDGGGGSWDDDDDEEEEETTEDTRSKDSSLASISVDGYELTADPNQSNVWSLQVPNSVGTINVNAVANDSLATVSGTGEHQLAIGENYCTVTITAENETSTDYVIYVYRSEGYATLSSLDQATKDCDDGKINLYLGADETLDEATIEKIKTSGASVIVYKTDEARQKMNILAMCVQTKDGAVWYEADTDGKLYNTESIDEKETETEETSEAEQETTEAETIEADENASGVDLFLITTIVLGAGVIGLGAAFILRGKKSSR